jgi:hypothetical protein
MSIFAFVFVWYERLRCAVAFLKGPTDAPRELREYAFQKRRRNAIGTV